MLQTKICVPRSNEEVIRRERTETKLDSSTKTQFVYISAPAGYGKTTAAIDFANRRNKKIAWFSIDSEDNGIVDFWSNVIAAIAKGTGEKEYLDIPIDSSLNSSNLMIELLIKSVDRIGEDFVLVFDDFHLIHNKRIFDSVVYFINYIPASVCLVIISRRDPIDELSLFLALGKGQYFGMNDLSFSKKDVKEFFLRKGLLWTEKEIDNLYQYTEGWPAGLVAVSMYLHENGLSHIPLGVSSKWQKDIALFLEKEVFEKWPEETRSFLVRTSFLDKFSSELCAAVTENEESMEILDTLLQNNGFVTAFEGDGKWYRYHHLFQEFLLRRFEKFDAAETKRLYGLAGNWHAKQGNSEDAINWLLKAHEYKKAMMLIDEFAHNLTHSAALGSEYSRWKEWVNVLPEEIYAGEVRFYTFPSWIAFMENNIDQAEAYIKRAWRCFYELSDNVSEEYRKAAKAQILFGELNIYVKRVDIQKVAQNISRLQRLKLNTGVLMGDLNWGEPNMIKTPYGFRNRKQGMDLYILVADLMYQYMGDASIFFAIIIAEHYYEQNKIAQVNSILNRCICAILEKKRPGAIIPTYILYAKVKMAKGDIDGAHYAIVEAKQRLDEKVLSVWEYHLDIFEAKLYLQTGEIEKAFEIIDRRKISIFDPIICVRESEYILYARLLMETDELDDALILLNSLERFTIAEERSVSLLEVICVMALCYVKKSDYPNAFAYLGKALDLGYSDDFFRTFIDEGEPMANLLERYLAHNKNSSSGKHLSYAKSLYRQTQEYILSISASQRQEAADSKGLRKERFDETEVKILQLMEAGLSNHEMAEELFFAVNTIKKYNSRIYDKLGVKSRFDAVAKAKKLGILA